MPGQQKEGTGGQERVPEHELGIEAGVNKPAAEEQEDKKVAAAAFQIRPYEAQGCSAAHAADSRV